MELQMPLFNATEAGDVATIKRLVAEGMDVNVQAARSRGEAAPQGGTARACGCGTSAGGVGADKDVSDADGWRPLHVAAWQGQVAVVTTLVELGANIGAVLDSGETPLQLSIRYGHHHVAQVLRSARTKKEAEAKQPTQEAIEQANRKCGGVQVLQYGAD
jgi:hypothetical protein